MNLSDFMNSVSIFEVTESSVSGKSEVCLGRVKEGADKREEETWFTMIAETYLRQKRTHVKAVSFSKQYLLLSDDSLVYFWKVVCWDLKWLMENMPRLDKTLEWQKSSVCEVGLSEGPKGEVWGRVSLPGVRGGLKLGPQPEDIGQISDAKAGNR